MPEKEIEERGGAKKYRTIKVGKDKYMHVAVVPKAGPEGGHTVAGPVHTKKSEENPHHKPHKGAGRKPGSKW